jgi:hypothetical protein
MVLQRLLRWHHETEGLAKDSRAVAPSVRSTCIRFTLTNKELFTEQSEGLCFVYKQRLVAFT